MNKNNFFKKAQALPLNTIVIAILVIIVLVVIIVFFNTSVEESGDQLSSTSKSFTSCVGNSFYEGEYDNVAVIDKATCKSNKGSVLPASIEGEGICCGWNNIQ